MLIFNAMFILHMQYLISVWGDTTKQYIKMEQNKILKLIYETNRMTPTIELYRPKG